MTTTSSSPAPTTPPDDATVMDPSLSGRFGKAIGPGVTLGGFQLERLLGRGAMGEVWLARQLSMGRDVALKTLPPQMAMDRNYVNRFLREVKVAAKLEHAHIVTAYEAGEADGVLYLAMALVLGETVADRLKREGMLREKEALRIVRQVAEALTYAWDEHHLLHRDIKPSNIMLNRRGDAKLMDLGISKCVQDGMELTLTETVMGTPNYMSPEQLEGKSDLDFRSDLYALGMTLYQMLTNQVPFKSSSVIETLRKQAIETLPSARLYNASLSDGCLALLETMLAKRREQRHASWAALVADVDRVGAGKTPLQPALNAGDSVMIRSKDLRTGAATAAVPRPPTAAPAPTPTAIRKPEPRPQQRRTLSIGRLVRWAVFLGLVGYGAYYIRHNPRWSEDLWDHTNVLFARLIGTTEDLLVMLKDDARGAAAPTWTPPKRAPHATAAEPALAPGADGRPSPRTLDEALADLRQETPALKADVQVAADGIKLILADNPTLRSIQPLAGLPLLELDLSRTAVTDLSALAGMPLRRLDLSRSAARDFQPLAGLRALKVLELRHTAFQTLNVLSNMAALHSLALSDCPVADLAPLRQLPKLKDLELGRNPLVNLDKLPLFCPQLEILRLPAQHGLRLDSEWLYRFASLKYVILDGRPLSVEQAARLPR